MTYMSVMIDRFSLRRQMIFSQHPVNVSSSYFWYTKKYQSNNASERPQRKKGTRKDNKNLIQSYFESNPTKRKYRKLMIEIWTESTKLDTSSQRLTVQITLHDFNERLTFWLCDAKWTDKSKKMHKNSPQYELKHKILKQEVYQQKKNLSSNKFCCSGGPQSENKRKRKARQSLGLCEWTKNKLWNMRVTVIPIVLGVVRTVTRDLAKSLEKLKIRERIETIHNTGLFRSARILRRVQETWGDLLSLRLQWYEKFAGSGTIIIIIEKCAMLMRRRKRLMAKGIKVPNQEKFRMFWEKETYKYLEILEADTIKQVDWKKK